LSASPRQSGDEWRGKRPKPVGDDARAVGVWRTDGNGLGDKNIVKNVME